MLNDDYYRDETARLRENIDRLRQYAEASESEYDNDGDCAMSSYRRGMAAAYGDMARKLAVAEHGEIITGGNEDGRS